MVMTSKYRYVVLAACSLVNFIALGYAVGLGVIFIKLISHFGTSRAEMATLQSFCDGLIFAGALVASPFVRWLGPTVCCIVGGFVSGSCVLAAAFVSSTPGLIVLVGLVTGFSLCFCHLVSYLTISQVFCDRSGFGEAVVTAGGGLGMFCMPIVNHYLMEEYGWRGTFLLLSGFLYNICMLGMVTHTFKQKYFQAEREERITDCRKAHDVKQSSKTEVEVSCHRDQQKEIENNLTDSRFVQNTKHDVKHSSQIPSETNCNGDQQEHSDKSVHLKHTSTDSQLPNKTKDDVRQSAGDQHGCPGDQSKSYDVQQEQNDKDKKADYEADENCQVDKDENYLRSQRDADYDGKNRINIQTVCVSYSSTSVCLGEVIKQEHDESDTSKQDTCRNLPGRSGEENLSFENDEKLCRNNQKVITTNGNQATKQTGEKHEDTACTKVCFEESNAVRRENRMRTLYTYLGLKVFKKIRFTVLLLEQIPMWLCLKSELFLIVDVVIEKGYDLESGSYFLSAFSIASVTGNLFGGYITSIFNVRGLSLAGASACCGSALALAISFVGDFIPLMLLVVLAGFCFGLIALCLPVMVLELLDADVYATSLALLFGTSGFSNLMSGPMGGAIRDVTGSYTLMFYGISVILMMSGLIKLYLAWLTSKHPIRNLVDLYVMKP